MRYIIFAIVLLATPATAQIVESSDGERFRVSYNEHGAVFKSLFRTIYLGRDCDASLDGVGGMWAWANGGFVIQFPKWRYGFPRQEIEIATEKCRM